MSSMVRNWQRKAARRQGREASEPQVHMFKDGSYSVLRPTKGWIHFTAQRLRIMRRTAELQAGNGSFV